jgi:hypothetical protein
MNPHLTTASHASAPTTVDESAAPAEDSDPEGGYASSFTPKWSLKKAWDSLSVWTHMHTHAQTHTDTHIHTQAHTHRVRA